MLTNWKKAYISGTLSRKSKQGRKKCDADDLEILKKCFAQLMKNRSE